MVSSISSTSSEAGRNLLLEMLAKSKTKNVTTTSETSSEETTSSSDIQEVSFEDLMQLMSSSRSHSEMAPPPEEGTLSSDIDSDGDGTLSTDEYDLMIADMGISGALSSEEFFTQYDVNSDGEITADEMPEPGSVAPSMSAASETSELADDSNDSNLLLQRMAMDAIRAYEESYGYSASSEQASTLDNIA